MLLAALRCAFGGFALNTSRASSRVIFFFFNDTATTEIYTLSLHDALPIFEAALKVWETSADTAADQRRRLSARSEEHTSELQSQSNLVCRLLLEKKNQTSQAVSSRSHTP